ncbi:MAG: hypothetical protein ACC651_17260 [Candidatus Scalindua sp.]
MSLALKTDKKYTYKDYLKWPDDERWELIDGVAYNKSSAVYLNLYNKRICRTYQLHSSLRGMGRFGNRKG